MKHRWVIGLILLLAFALRTYRLTEIPPGLTHDEANHGVEAMGVLDGELRFYFPRNYGSEPLYSYLVALTMWGGGENLLSLRLVNVWFGVLVIAAAYRLTLDLFRNSALSHPAHMKPKLVAQLAAATLTLTFWPLASSREALRAGVLPFLMTLAVLVFWRMVSGKKLVGTRRNSGELSEQSTVNGQQLAVSHSPFTLHPSPFSRLQSLVSSLSISQSLTLSFLIALTIHTYLAARVAWLVFPVFLGYLFLWHREWFWRSWKPVVLGLVVAGVLVIPMFRYLQTNPYAETRLEMLDSTLQTARAGNLKPLLANVGKALAAFVVPGYGDQFLAYNIPGRPVFDALMGLLALIGLGVALWRWRQPAYTLLLVWIIIGIAPSLITGPTANTTRNLAALTPLMLLPALGLVSCFAVRGSRASVAVSREPLAVSVAPTASRRRLTANFTPHATSLISILVLALSAFITSRDYFGRWGEDPDVRAAYQQNLVQAVAWVNEHAAASSPILFSTVYPGPAHDPAIAQVLLADKERPTRWMDARLGLIFPSHAAATLIIPSSTPLHPTFTAYAPKGEQIALRPDDLDPFFTIYPITPPSIPSGAEPVNFNGAIQLIGVVWGHNPVQPGDVVELQTWWQVLDPTRVGPIVPPSFTTDVTFFTQILRPDNTVLVQQDRLDGPSWGWQTGDIVVQIHQLIVPGDAAAGEYQTIVGMYDRSSLQRTPVTDSTGLVVDDKATITPLIIVREE